MKEARLSRHLKSTPLANHIDGLLAAEDFLFRSDADVETDRWLKARGVDTAQAWNLAGPLVQHDVIIKGRLFNFAEPDDHHFERAIIHLVYDDKGEWPVDLVAWTRQRPGSVFRRLGVGDALGIGQICNPASYFGGQALRLHRTPLDWLIAGCRGVMIINPMAVRAKLANLARRPGRYLLAAPDLPFGLTIRRMLSPLPDGVRIVVPMRGIE